MRVCFDALCFSARRPAVVDEETQTTAFCKGIESSIAILHSSGRDVIANKVTAVHAPTTQTYTITPITSINNTTKAPPRKFPDYSRFLPKMFSAMQSTFVRWYEIFVPRQQKLLFSWLRTRIPY